MLTDQTIETVVRAALLEDAPWGDLTSQLLIPESAVAGARLSAREAGTFSGGAVFTAAMKLTDPAIEVDLLVSDGAAFEAGDTLATVTGPARSVLQAERVALNLVQRMSGIATLTAAYVAQVAHTSARIVDTRKTTPGLRAFERHAVRSGGGHNHRFSLSDAVMAKDNHLAVLTAQSGLSVTDALLAVRAQLSHTTHLEVEVDRIDQIGPVLEAGVDTIMLDNFTVDDLREGVALIAGRAIVEASGNVNLSTVRAIAESGVDVISVGAVTHSVRSLDLGLDVIVEASAAAATPVGATEPSAP
ncbi:MAG TPA: carboxylating nicotinate-nucleotide diphosphorylase [Leifsonia sp.]|jgi:nicotinate-nucleotide pyrophosphorylase (carboxylating)|nr:carboxylating nicotinate-nucleotide diphosphorylase [Leifsonia sp.]